MPIDIVLTGIVMYVPQGTKCHAHGKRVNYPLQPYTQGCMVCCHWIFLGLICCHGNQGLQLCGIPLVRTLVVPSTFICQIVCISVLEV